MTTTTAAPTAAALEVGTPATIHYYTDDRAAVVTKVTAKRVWISRVETIAGSARTENEAEVAGGAMPVRVEDGDVTKPLGKSEMFTLRTDRDGKVFATQGSPRGGLRVRFGYSTTRVDYRF